MPLPQVAFGTAADEDALAQAIETLAIAVGWTTWGPAGTFPTNSFWFQSSGEDGISHIVGGLVPDSSTRRMRAACAADIDTSGIANANVGGWVNDDAAGISTLEQSITPNTSGGWHDRDSLSQYEYMAVADLNGITVLVKYDETGGLAQGVIVIGNPEPAHGRLLQTQAKARIASIATNGALRTITLDADINAALKDRTAFPSDPHTLSMMFQPVNSHGGGTEDNDFAMVERFPIVDSSLTLSGGNTQFDIAVAGGVKLGGLAGRRYNDNRGVGDVVKMMSEPNVVFCFGEATQQRPSTTSNAVLAAWDNYGGQRGGSAVGDNLDMILMNELYTQASANAPSVSSGLAAEFRLYALNYDKETGLIAQTDKQGHRVVGALRHIIIIPEMSAGHASFLKVNGTAHRRYRVLGWTGGRGLGRPYSSFAAGGDPQWAVGPGW